MSRPKTPKSKSRSKSGRSEVNHRVEPAAAAKVASSDSTPDHKGKEEHRADAHKDHPAEEQPWSEWVWYEEAQMCYRGRKDSKGEWEYEFASLPKEKERPYTPPREEPIEYLIEELKIIWEPRLIEIPGDNLVTGTAAPAKDSSKTAGNGAVKAGKVEAVIEEEKAAKNKEEKTSKGDEKESTTSSTKKSEKHERHEKSRKERPVERRGRQLERKHFNPKERKDKVEAWRKEVE